MFVRKTQTRNKSTAESYFTYRLVASERSGKQVRQVTLLNLGRHFDLPRGTGRACAPASMRCSRGRVPSSPNRMPSKPWPNATPPA
jgi:hypothetical protein